MAPYKHIKSGKSFKEDMIERRAKIEQGVDTMDIDGVTYFPCRTCNRLFKDEKLARCHLKKCKPRVYLVSKTLSNETAKPEGKDPYEIIPEEIELEGQMVNNNTSNENKNSSGRFKWKKNIRKCTNNNELENTLKMLDKNPSVLDTSTNSICTVEPKKHIVQSVNSSQESDSFTSRTRETISVNKVKIIEKQTTKRKKTSTTEKRKRNYRQLTEQEIEERLKKISDRLKKHKQPETINEEEEEEERREIEERLSVLNKESEVCIQNGVEDSGVRLKEKTFFSEPSQQNVQNCQVSVGSDIFGDISENNIVQEYMDNMPNMKNEILRFRKQNAVNTQSEVDGVVVITQRPDGQLHACRKCSQVFLSSLELLRHSRREHTYPRIIMAPDEISKFMSLKDRSHCPICEKPLSSTYKSIYLKHLQTHSCILEHICPICKKKFKRRDHMRAHQKRHIVGNNLESTELKRNCEVDAEDLQEFVEYP